MAPCSLERPVRRPAPAPPAIVALLVITLASPAFAAGPFWHVDTFNAANLGGTGNHAMWCGVPSGTAGYATAPGYGNNWNDRLYWRRAAPSATAPTTVRLRFAYNHDLQPGADFLLVEWESSGSFATLASISGSNKNSSGQFVTPATFDQTWTIPAAAHGGPLHDQVVLRLRVVTNASGSDQDGGFNSSGACQLDNIQVDFNGSTVSTAAFETSGGDGGWTPFDRQAVADYVRDHVLGGDYSSVLIRMTPQPVNQAHVARDYDPLKPQLAMPYAQNWVVLIDDLPGANLGHPCRWVVVNADLSEHSGPIARSFPPRVLGAGGSGARVPVTCDRFTPLPCPPIDAPPSIGPGPEGDEASCLHAVLISGGISAEENHRNYRINLGSMYRKLREIGYPKDNIDVFYADGAPLDLDNLDGDNNHATGSEVVAEARRSLIRDRISGLCATLDRRRDILFVYTTNHGQDSGNLMLYWLDEQELWWITPGDFADDTRNCDVCRLFVLMDQCYSGAFTPMATDGGHDNLAIYTAATALEPSFAREYLAEWEDLDPAALTMNEMHAMVEAGNIASTPVTAEGAPGNGDHYLNECGSMESAQAPWDTPLCLGQSSVEVGVTVCNLLGNDHTYDLAFAGDPADAAAGCSIDGPTGFTVLDPLPLAVPSGACARVRVRIDRPAGMDTRFETGCYTVTVTNRERGSTFSCRGSLVDHRNLCADWLVGRDAQMMPPGLPRRFVLKITGTGTSASASSAGNAGPAPASGPMPYVLTVAASDRSGAPNLRVSLNGLPPGTPVTGVLPAPAPGEATDLAVDVLATQPDFFFHDLRFLADIDGDSFFEPLASLGLRLVSAPVTSVPRVEAARPLTVSPNPLRGAAVVSFAPGGERKAVVTLEVLDLLGRRVRTLASGAPAGPGRASWVWRGDDDTGRRLPAGIYVIRLREELGTSSTRVVLLR